MDKNAKIYVAGHRGLAGSAIVRQLEQRVTATCYCVRMPSWSSPSRPQCASFFRANARLCVSRRGPRSGGIVANSSYPAEFVHSNLAVQTNVLHESWRAGVKRLLFLGRRASTRAIVRQPIKEDYLLTGRWRRPIAPMPWPDDIITKQTR